MKNLVIHILLVCCILSLSNCQSKFFTIYKIDVQQGNALEAEVINKITLGMSKEQVRLALGSPLLVDSFHPDRWDYVYHFTPGYGEQERRHLTLIFDRDEVIDIIKDNIIAEDTTTASKSDSKDESESKSETESDTSTTDEEANEQRKEQEELEEQAEELKDILETNKDPIK